MLKLLILRHAKAADPSLYPTDFERPLTEKGWKQCEAQKAALKGHGYRRGLILCSPAQRTLETMHGVFGERVEDNNQTTMAEGIYEASLAGLLEVLRTNAGNAPDVAIIGHNPSISGLAQRLSGGKAGPFDTCGAALLHFKEDTWADAVASIGQVLWQNTPKV